MLNHQPAGAGNPELKVQARSCLGTLTPSLYLERIALAATPVRVEVWGHPGQNYEVQVSSDLTAWFTIDQRRSTTNRYAVEDAAAPAGATSRFYRVLWRP